MEGATENYLATGNSVCGEEEQLEIDRVLEHIVDEIQELKDAIAWASKYYKVDYEELKEAVKELGVWIAENNHILVYGGSKIGLMGELADSVLNADGMAIGVEPEFFIDDNLQHENLSELIITSDLQDRKRKMIELGDAFIAFPGGTGTLDEITEIMTKVALKQINAPCIVYNLNGYYDSLKVLLDHMIEMGLSTSDKQEKIYFANNLLEIEEILTDTNE